jgi:hypothetical protein
MNTYPELTPMDPDKRQAILLSSPQRLPVLRQVERLGQLLRDLDQIDPPPTSKLDAVSSCHGGDRLA